MFVTGESNGSPSSGTDYATVAYNAAAGAQQWARRYNGPANSTDRAASAAVSPAGSTVYVTGYSAGTTSSDDYATIAYNPTTGTRRWAARYNGPANYNDEATAIAVSHNTGTVYVTGYSTAGSGDYATIAYSG